MGSFSGALGAVPAHELGRTAINVATEADYVASELDQRIGAPNGDQMSLGLETIDTGTITERARS